jgi:ribosome-binding ATPase
MRLGIIGLPNSGKTTIFNALTGSSRPTGAVSTGQMEIHTEVVTVPDERVDKLIAMYEPKKHAYANVVLSDFGGLDKGFGESGLSGQLKNELAQLDGLIHVVRAFEDEGVPHPYETVDLARDIAILDQEFLLSDLVAIEKRLERVQEDLKKGKKDGASEKDQALLERLKEALENETPLRDLEISLEEEKSLRGFGFFSLKPVLVIFNAGDEAKPDNLVAYPHQNAKTISLQGKIEAEIAQLSAEDAALFLEEYGIAESSTKRVLRSAYELLNLQSFFTVGKDEVRAWSVKVGATAPEAAGAIHSDLQHGFIRAEVMAYDALMTLGSEQAVKDAGKMRLEGKTYIVQDGDIVHIRHSS